MDFVFSCFSSSIEVDPSHRTSVSAAPRAMSRIGSGRSSTLSLTFLPKQHVATPQEKTYNPTDLDISFSMLMLDMMVAEGVSALTALLTLVFFRISLDTESTSFNADNVVANGLVAVIGEVFVANYVVLLVLQRFGGGERKDVLGGWQLKMIWDRCGRWTFISGWLLGVLGTLGFCVMNFAFSLCPVFTFGSNNEVSDLFFKACPESVLASALQLK
jgi:hypothetical protein